MQHREDQAGFVATDFPLWFLLCASVSLWFKFFFFGVHYPVVPRYTATSACTTTRSPAAKSHRRAQQTTTPSRRSAQTSTPPIALRDAPASLLPVRYARTLLTVTTRLPSSGP